MRIKGISADCNRIFAYLAVFLLAGTVVAIAPGATHQTSVWDTHAKPDEDEVSPLPGDREHDLDPARSKSPVYFEPNQGQFHDDVVFKARTKGYTFYLTGSQAVFVLSFPSESLHSIVGSPYSDDFAGSVVPRSMEREVFRMEFVDPEPGRSIKGVDPLQGKSHYLKGPDPDQWVSHVPHYEQLVVEGLWPGIDAVFYGTDQGRIRYDFVVQPGATVEDIRLSFADAKTRLEEGDLLLERNDAELRIPAPYSYQGGPSDHDQVASGFAFFADNYVGFHVSGYDGSRPLVIDPEVQSQTLVYSTYLGGGEQDDALGVAADDEGNTYVAGETHSSDFPTENPYQGENSGGDRDQFVTKLDPSGSLVYSTYIGGGGFDYAFDVVVDDQGRAAVGGYTGSDAFPTTPGAFQESRPGLWAGTLVKLSAQGDDLVFSTFLGGSELDAIRRVAIDDDGHIYVTGRTESPDFPVENPFQPVYPGVLSGFVTKFETDGKAVAYSTFLGGGGQDSTTGIAVGADKSVVVVGQTGSQDYPLKNAYQDELLGTRDAMVTKLSPAGDSLVFSTYLGGSGTTFPYDGAIAVDVDSTGHVYVTGAATSADFPVKDAYQPQRSGSTDVFLTKFTPEGLGLVYSTYFGGSGFQEAWGIAVDPAGNVSISGVTLSADFPKRTPVQSSYGGSGDAFVATFEPEGQVLLFSSYLGGGSDDFSRDLATDQDGDLHVVGNTQSTDYLTENAQQDDAPGSRSAFISKIKRPQWFKPFVGFDFTPGGPAPLDDIVFVGALSAGSGKIVSSQWDFGDDTTSEDTIATHRFATEGDHTVTLMATDEMGETANHSETVTVSGRLHMSHTAPLHHDVSAGQAVTLEGRLTNKGDKQREIDLTVTVDRGWNASAVPASVTLGAGESMRVPVIVQVGEDGGAAQVRLRATNDTASDGFLVWRLDTPVFVNVEMNDTTVGSTVRGFVHAVYKNGGPATGLALSGTRSNGPDVAGVLQSGFSGETDADGRAGFSFDVLDPGAQIPGTHLIEVTLRLGGKEYRGFTSYQMEPPGPI